MSEVPADVWRWWAIVRPSPAVTAELRRLALGRAQVFLPVMMVALAIALGVSETAGVPLSAPLLVLNAVLLAGAVVLLVQLRRGTIAAAHGHATIALVWLLGPIGTLAAAWLTSAPELAGTLMIELATLPIMLSTRWALATSVPVVVTAFPLMSLAGSTGMYPVSVVGVWVVAMIMMTALRRSSIRAETNRVDLQHALTSLEHELAERQRAEADREQLRDQFVHAQRMEAVGTLAAGLAHDMNNILGGILAFAELLRAEETAPQAQADLDRICHEAERGAALTRGLLAFSRRGAYRQRPLRLASVLDDIAPLLARTLGTGVQLERADGPPTTVTGDPAQLGQILINLCVNAADAMNGRGTITITTAVVTLARGEHGVPADGTYATLAVTDTGAGMDEATRKRMFEPFFTTKPVGKGTGLGLAMVYGAVEAHRGAIEVASSPEGGTTIAIYLPTTDEPVGQPAAAKPRAAGLRGLVLIVDDEAAIRAGAARIVEKLGLTAVTASDGIEALAVFRAHPDEVVLVLLDMMMPRMNGTDCFHALRALRSLRPVPILLMSGYTNHTAAQELLAAGASGFLEKPFAAAQLGAEIDRILGPRATA